jgi:hypothetical protein
MHARFDVAAVAILVPHAMDPCANAVAYPAQGRARTVGTRSAAGCPRGAHGLRGKAAAWAGSLPLVCAAVCATKRCQGSSASGCQGLASRWSLGLVSLWQRRRVLCAPARDVGPHDRVYTGVRPRQAGRPAEDVVWTDCRRRGIMAGGVWPAGCGSRGVPEQKRQTQVLFPVVHDEQMTLFEGHPKERVIIKGPLAHGGHYSVVVRT